MVAKKLRVMLLEYRKNGVSSHKSLSGAENNTVEINVLLSLSLGIPTVFIRYVPLKYSRLFYTKEYLLSTFFLRSFQKVFITTLKSISVAC